MLEGTTSRGQDLKAIRASQKPRCRDLETAKAPKELVKLFRHESHDMEICYSRCIF